jgi:hypothetical protein
MPALGAGARKSVRVRIPPPAQPMSARLRSSEHVFVPTSESHSGAVDTVWTHFFGQYLVCKLTATTSRSVSNRRAWTRNVTLGSLCPSIRASANTTTSGGAGMHAPTFSGRTNELLTVWVCSALSRSGDASMAVRCINSRRRARQPSAIRLQLRRGRPPSSNLYCYIKI